MNFEKPKTKTELYTKSELQFEQRLGANRACYIINSVKKELELNKNFSELEGWFKEIKNVEKFVEQNLPKLTKKEKFCPDGFYSPAHMMYNAIRLLEIFILRKETKNLIKALTTADQIMRLLGSSMYRKEIEIPDDYYLPGYRVKNFYESFELPNILEIPEKWKQTSEGRKFYKELKEFIKRRKQNKPIIKRDFELLKDMTNSVINSYKGELLDKEKYQNAPRARELILINLELLRLEAEKYKGQNLPYTETNASAIQLIRGLYNYNEEAEIHERLYSRGFLPNFFESTGPKIISTPEKLRT